MGDETTRFLAPQVEELADRLEHILEQSAEEVKERLPAMSEQAVTEAFPILSAAARKMLVEQAPETMVTQAIRGADREMAVETLAVVSETVRARALKSLPPDEAAALIAWMEPEHREKWLDVLDASARDEVRRLLTYPPGSAGALMTPRFVSVHDGITVGEAIERIRRSASAEAIFYIYVVDVEGKLVGTVSVRKLLLAEPGDALGPLVGRDVVVVPAEAPQEEAARIIQRHNYLALPVVDPAGKMLGIITVDDVVAIVRQENERTLHDVVGLEMGAGRASISRAFLGRMPWFFVTLAGGLGCAIVTGVFQRQLKEAVLLLAFVPLILALVEAIAMQTVTVILKRLSGGAEPGFRLRPLVLREMATGMAIGLVCAGLAGGASVIVAGSARFAIGIAVAVIATMTWGAGVAVALPTAVRKLGADPAVASGPVVLTCVDITSLVAYFAIALALAGQN